MTTEDFNGWANRETWALFVHISNDESLYTAIMPKVKDPSYDLARGLKKGFEALVQEVIEGGRGTPEIRAMLFDIGSLWRVNFEEIAKALRQENA